MLAVCGALLGRGGRKQEKSQFFFILGVSGVAAGLKAAKPADQFNGEFDPGSELTLAACITHASRAGLFEIISMAA